MCNPIKNLNNSAERLVVGPPASLLFPSPSPPAPCRRCGLPWPAIMALANIAMITAISFAICCVFQFNLMQVIWHAVHQIIWYLACCLGIWEQNNHFCRLGDRCWRPLVTRLGYWSLPNWSLLFFVGYSQEATRKRPSQQEEEATT